ncbi:MAG: hypothetical protein ACLFPD_07105, partial [Desulfosudaceae bacterium]
MILIGIPLIILLVLLWQLVPRLEGQAPAVTVLGFKSAVGAAADFTLVASDDQSGLRKVWAALLVDGQEHVLTTYEPAETETAPPAEKRLAISIEPAKMHLPDGPAVLRIGAWDHSWRNWGQGNHTYIEKRVTIDTRPPAVEVISRQHYLNPGGAALAVYRVPEDGVRHGVQVGQDFFPGYSGAFADPHLCLAFFALTHDQDRDVPVNIRAEDAAGNITKAGFYYHVKSKTFPDDRLTISDSFLRRKMPEFSGVSGDSPVDKFIRINSEMRRENNATIRSLCRQTEAKLL